MAQATVKRIDDDDRITIRVRRNQRDETLYNRVSGLEVGQQITVKRQTNNPFPIFVAPMVYKDGYIVG